MGYHLYTIVYRDEYFRYNWKIRALIELFGVCQWTWCKQQTVRVPKWICYSYTSYGIWGKISLWSVNSRLNIKQKLIRVYDRKWKWFRSVLYLLVWQLFGSDAQTLSWTYQRRIGCLEQKVRHICNFFDCYLMHENQRRWGPLESSLWKTMGNCRRACQGAFSTFSW